MLMISNYQANVYLGPEEVLKGETAESLLRVKTSLEVLQLFRSTYEDHRANLRKYQKNGTMVKPWDFSTLLIFSRLDQFIKRLQNIKEFEGDVRDFKLMVDDTDRRLGAIFCQAFDDASGLEHTFKVW
ncbi:hypothetical protein XENOCAPTIV_003683 [Xenoophorus captivus]|uniref:Dynein heavy chain tail domain-containing protein n=1 Tax=Xenoophorus captivus TaxID=1517983 RepID=A0ABV0SFF7_9TELE